MQIDIARSIGLLHAIQYADISPDLAQPPTTGLGTSFDVDIADTRHALDVLHTIMTLLARGFASSAPVAVPLDTAGAPVHASRMNCPVCDTPAKEHPTTADRQVFECPAHGSFAVSETVMAMGFERMEAWKKANALDHARTYMRPCDKIPVITSYHL